MWIDSHAHLNDPAFCDDWEERVAVARDAGVGRIVVAGYDLESSRRAIWMATQNPVIYATVGIHPQDALTWNSNTEAELRSMLCQPKVVAVGEIGLDYHYDEPGHAEQLRAFKGQLLMAGYFSKPVVIHSRDAAGDTLAVLNEIRPGPAGGVLHCFSGSRETALQYLALGLRISFSGALTFRNAHKLREVAAALPLDKLMVETDSPYLAPDPYRGRRNEPAWVGLVGEQLAKLHEVPAEAAMDATCANTCALFHME